MNFLWVTDVPTPYRNHSFERMAAIFPKMGIDFSVAFMAERSKQREWSFAPKDLRYPHTVFRGAGPVLGGVEWHVNPSLLVRLRTRTPDVVMVGGWASPTHLMAPWMTPKGAIKILGCESHLDSIQRTSRAARWVKRRTIERYDAFLIPQARSRELLISLEPGCAHKPYIVFPNLVDATLFATGVDIARAEKDVVRAHLRVAPDEQLWLCVARPSAEKGVEGAVMAMSGATRAHLVVAGDGPLRGRLERLARQRDLRVRFLGHQSVAQLTRLYAAADLFVLSSLRDASPLSVIEACAAGLPLFVSNRIGNIDDVLEEGNGFVFEVGEHRRNVLRAHQIQHMSRQDLAAMGLRSRAIYEQRFDSDTSVRRLGDAILGLWRAAPNGNRLATARS